MRFSERELSLQRGKTTVFDRHEKRLRVRVNTSAIRFRIVSSLSYDDIAHAVQNTTDSCINSATDRRDYVLEQVTKFSDEITTL